MDFRDTDLRPDDDQVTPEPDSDTDEGLYNRLLL